MTYATVRLTGEFNRTDRTPGEGWATIVPSRLPLVDTEGKVILDGVIPAKLDNLGHLAVDAPASDDPTFGEPFTYDIVVSMGHARWSTTGLSLPASIGTFDLAEVPTGAVVEYVTREAIDAAVNSLELPPGPAPDPEAVRAAVEAEITTPGTPTATSLLTTIAAVVADDETVAQAAAAAAGPAVEAAAADLGLTPPLIADGKFNAGSPLQSLTATMTSASGWGSSSMNLLATRLAPAFTNWGATYYNGSQPGERAAHILARLGSHPARLTFPGGTIPATGSVTVTSSNLPASSSLLTYEGTVAGVRGQVSSTADTLTFTRTIPGMAVPVTVDAPFVPTVGPLHRADVMVLQPGKNDLTGTAGRETLVNKMTDEAVAWLSPLVKRFVVVGDYANTDATAAQKAQVAAVNAHRSQRYGNLYVDVADYLAGPQVWADTGITPTQTDLDHQGARVLPDSLTDDGVHLTAAGYDAVAALITGRIDALGWYAVPPTPTPDPEPEPDPEVPDLVTGLRWTLDAADLALTDGAPVTSWAATGDAPVTFTGGNINGWTAPTLAATGGPDGGKAVTFGGTANPQRVRSGTGQAGTGPLTYVAAVKVDPSSASDGIIIFTSLRVFGGNTFAVDTGGGNTVPGQSGVLPSPDWHIIVAVIDGPDSHITIDGVRTVGGAAATATVDQLVMGGSSGAAPSAALGGRVRRLARFERALTATDADAITGVWADQLGITI